jgi:sigma-B regulation protein RsbU (phosphoserine phosphatase)
LDHRRSDDGAGRIYYETHIAPLLRMQGSFERIAIDVLNADGQPLQMIANATKRRNPVGKLLSIRLALIIGERPP